MLAWILNLDFAASPADAPIPTPTPPAQAEEFTGGFLFAFEQEMARRRKKRKEIEEREQAAQDLKDQVEREIAAFLYEQEKADERRAELQRLRSLVRAHARAQSELTERAQRAYARALAQENFSAMQALEREIERMLEEEEAALMILLNED